MRKPVLSRRRRKKMTRKLLPIFAPLVMLPVVTPMTHISAKPTSRQLQERMTSYKLMEFNQVAYSLYQQMGQQQQGLRFDVFDKALAGFYNMRRDGVVSEKPVITIVDFSKSSVQKRLWVLDLEKKEVLFNTYVAHGRGSGEDFAEHFSNQNESYMSSIGFYVTNSTYTGKHGLSLRLDGMDEGFNTNARDRCIVMHGAEYASQDFIAQAGRLGRSLGCPAIPMEHHEEIINAVQGGTALYVHAANDAYTSHYLDHVSALAELVKENKTLAAI